MNLKSLFFDLFNTAGNASGVAVLWDELDAAYTAPARHYHSWQHIAQLVLLLEETIPLSQNKWLYLAAFYHDAVYDVLRNDNEERSALLAAQRLKQAGLMEEDIQLCNAAILATKGHTITGHAETDIFTDADLAILGAASVLYHTYAAQIRAEYGIYPDAVYNPGRKAVLEGFMAMPAIFKTEQMRDRFEANARANIAGEMQLL